VQDGLNFGWGGVLRDATHEVDVAFDELWGEDVMAVGADTIADRFGGVKQTVSAGNEDVWRGLYDDME
jgi:hypothetical protein